MRKERREMQRGGGGREGGRRGAGRGEDGKRESIERWGARVYIAREREGMNVEKVSVERGWGRERVDVEREREEVYRERQRQIAEEEERTARRKLDKIRAFRRAAWPLSLSPSPSKTESEALSSHQRQSVSTGVQSKQVPREVAEARAIISGLMSAVTQISDMSIYNHVPGQTPAVLYTSSFISTTHRVSVAGFGGLTVGDPEGKVRAELPANLFSENLEEPLQTETAIVMLVLWNITLYPLARPQGFSGAVREDFLSPVVSLEVRQTLAAASSLSDPVRTPGLSDPVPATAGAPAASGDGSTQSAPPSSSGASSSPLRLRALQPPATVRIASPRGVDERKDYSTGRGLVFGPVLWSWKNFSWTVTGIKAVRREGGEGGGGGMGAEGIVVVAEAVQLGHMSVINKMAGCDDVPESDAVIDSCRVCAGDNTTCSGDNTTCTHVQLNNMFW